MADPHLDMHPDDQLKLDTVRAKVVAVYLVENDRNETKDDSTGTTTGLIVYDLAVFQAFPCQSLMLSQVPAANQLTGSRVDEVDPYQVGDWVEVDFLEGSPDNPRILRRSYSEDHTSSLRNTNTSSTYPHRVKKVGDVSVEVDKDDNAVINLAEGKSLIIKDSSGDELLRIAKSGGNYEVGLGGSTGRKRLVHEDLIDAFNNHTHTETGGTTLTPLIPLVASALTTSVTKAK